MGVCMYVYIYIYILLEDGGLIKGPVFHFTFPQSDVGLISLCLINVKHQIL